MHCAPLLAAAHGGCLKDTSVVAPIVLPCSFFIPFHFLSQGTIGGGPAGVLFIEFRNYFSILVSCTRVRQEVHASEVLARSLSQDTQPECAQLLYLRLL